MKLAELRLSDLALFRSHHQTFSFGVNLIYGSNSSGKTVLLKAMRAAFSGQLETGLSCAECSSEPAVAVRYEHAGVEQLLEKVFGTESSGPPGFDNIPAEIFIRAGFMIDGGLVTLPADQLGPTLRRLCLSNELDDLPALETLQSEYRRLTSRDPWGQDRQADGELEKIRGRLKEIESEWDERLEALKKLGALREQEKAETQTQIPELKTSEAPAEPVAVVPDMAGEIDMAAEPLAVEPGMTELPVFGAEDDWPADEPEEFTQKDPRKIRERLWEVQKEAAALRQELVSVPELSTLLPSVLTLLFLVLGGLLALFYRDIWQAAAMASCGLVVFTWAVFVFLSRNKGSELGRLRENLSRVEAEREELLHDLDRLDEQRRYGAGDYEDQPVTEKLHVEAMEPEPQNETPSEDNIEEPVEETAQENFETPSETVWQQKRRLMAEVSDLRALEVEGETLRFREQEITHRLKTLTTAIEMLFQAEERISGKRRTQLAETFNHLVKGLLDASGLNASVSKNWNLEINRGDQSQVALADLSRGEQRLVGLALHMALLEQVEGLKLPLVADDALDDIGPAWRDGVLKVLEDFARRHQVIVTSRESDMHTRALASGWKIISLDGGAEKSKPKPKPSAPERSEDEQQLHLL